MTDVEKVRCPHCGALARVTKADFLGRHKSPPGRKRTCDGSGMNAQMAREAEERRLATAPRAVTSHLKFLGF